MEPLGRAVATQDAGAMMPPEAPLRRPGGRAGAWILAGCLAVVALIAIGIHYRWTDEPAVLDGSRVAPRAVPASPQAQTPPAAHYPVPAPPQQETLPVLAESDTFVQHALAELVGPEAMKLFRTDNIVRRVVATIDNLPRKGPLPRLLPLRRPDGSFAVTHAKDAIVADPGNSLRYGAYVWLVETANPKLVVALYARLYPLLQQQYRQLGYPTGEFNDRVVGAIDDLLAAPDLDDAPQLVQPNVFYQFADPDLESLSAGQKLMLRIGSDNADKVKAKLREIRGALLPI